MSASTGKTSDSRCPACGAEKPTDQRLCNECRALGERAEDASARVVLRDDAEREAVQRRLLRPYGWIMMPSFAIMLFACLPGAWKAGYLILWVLMAGAVLAVLGCRRNHKLSIRLLACMAASILAFGMASGLFAMLGWAPGKVRFSVLPHIALLVIAAIPFSILLLPEKKREWRPWECRKCGYPLFGLNEARCPECGQAFDPTSIPDRPPSMDES